MYGKDDSYWKDRRATIWTCDRCSADPGALCKCWLPVLDLPNMNIAERLLTRVEKKRLYPDRNANV